MDLAAINVTVDPFNSALVILTVKDEQGRVYTVLGIRPEPDAEPTTVTPVAVYRS